MGDKINDDGQIEDLQKRYQQLMHAVQSGISYHPDFAGMTDPKHLRVGVNSSMVSLAALVKLLVDKGVISELEYWTSLVSSTEAEIALYESEISAHVGKPVNLR